MEQTDDQLAALLMQICTEEAINRSERDPLWGVQMKSGTKPAMPTDGEPFTAQFALDLSPVFTWPDFSSIDLKRPTMTIDDETVHREFHNQRLAAGMDLDGAIHGAALARLRPILLTAISSLAGFLPLLLASGAGAASRTSIGTVVFSGLLVATVLSLFVVPVVYRIVKGWELGRRGSGAGVSPS